MKNQNISSCYNIKNRFLRSINLQRDFNDPDVLSNYFLTDHALECLNRISAGTKEKSTQRAWRITGDYGSGKSNFALFLAHWFQCDNIPKAIDVKIKSEGINRNNNKKFYPLLLTGARESIGISILKKLQTDLSQIKNSSKVVDKIETVLKGKKASIDSDVIDCIGVARDLICSSGYHGMIFIIDELGKFLEYAALHPEEQDIYLMQKLAEFASGSDKKPLFVIGILHQGFSAYADSLTQAAQHEWEKVAGRYDEVLFNQPLEQLAYLINSALGVNIDKVPADLSKTYENWMKFFIAKGWYGNAVSSNNLIHIATKLYPLHPSVFPVLVNSFRRFGQNERSLFSFLLSNETCGLQEFSSLQNEQSAYRLYDLYDYLKFNWGHKLHAQSYRSNWHIIDSLIDSFIEDDEFELKILKSIGVINLIDNNRFIATKETISNALGGIVQNSDKIISKVLDKLCKEKKVIYYRGNSGGYCLWPHTSVNLDAAYQNAQNSIGNIKNVSEYIKECLKPKPIVARRHYIKTGNLRAFDLKYCSTEELEKIVNQLATTQDGCIIVPLCETPEEYKKCISFAHKKELISKRNILLAIPKPLNALSSLIKEVKCWQYVEQNTLELNSDSYACEEVKRQQANALCNLERRLGNFVDVKTFSDQQSLQWYRQGEKQNIKNGRDLLSKLSDYFDSIYDKSPIIKNELLNRQNISSAAAAARMRLIAGILEKPNEYRLGMDVDKTPPEVAVYLSVLQKSGLHIEKDNKWSLQIPSSSDKCNFISAFNEIDRMMKNIHDNKIKVSELYRILKAPPYGLKDGTIPVILAVYYSIFEYDIAVYEEGTFVRKLREQEFLRLTKDPDRFEFQYCSIEGLRADIFKQISALLNIPLSKKNPHLLEIVKPLCVFAAQLPEYVLKSNRLSEKTIKVRDALLNAGEPINLIFRDLPNACGLEQITPETPGSICTDYINKLKDSIDELRFFYNSLKTKIKKMILDSFDAGKVAEFASFRNNIAERAQNVLFSVTEPELKAFALRIFDDNLGESEWIESIGSFVISKTPEKWTDVDEDMFYHKFPIIVNRFKNIESIIFTGSNKKNKDKEIGCKVSITKSSGEEHNQVLYYKEDEAGELKALQREIALLISKNPRLGILAASEEIWKKLIKEK